MPRKFDPSRSPAHGALLAAGFTWNGELEYTRGDCERIEFSGTLAPRYCARLATGQEVRLSFPRLAALAGALGL